MNFNFWNLKKYILQKVFLERVIFMSLSFLKSKILFDIFYLLPFWKPVLQTPS